MTERDGGPQGAHDKPDKATDDAEREEIAQQGRMRQTEDEESDGPEAA